MKYKLLISVIGLNFRPSQSIWECSGCSQRIEVNGSVPIASVQVFASQT